METRTREEAKARREERLYSTEAIMSDGDEMRQQLDPMFDKVDEIKNATVRGAKMRIRNIEKWALVFGSELDRLERRIEENGSIFPLIEGTRSTFKTLMSLLKMEKDIVDPDNDDDNNPDDSGAKTGAAITNDNNSEENVDVDHTVKYPVGCKVEITEGEDKGVEVEVIGHGEPEEFLVQDVTSPVVKIKGIDNSGVSFNGWQEVKNVRLIEKETETMKTVELSEIGFMGRFEDAIKVNDDEGNMLDVIGAAHEAIGNIDFVVVSIDGEEENVPVYKIKDVFTQKHVDEMKLYPLGCRVENTLNINSEGSVVGYYVYGEDLQLRVDNGLGIGSWSIGENVVIVGNVDSENVFEVGDRVVDNKNEVGTVTEIQTSGAIVVRTDRRKMSASIYRPMDLAKSDIAEVVGEVAEEAVEEAIEEIAVETVVDTEEEAPAVSTADDDTENVTSEPEAVVEDDSTTETVELSQDEILGQAKVQLTETVGSTDRRFDAVETTVSDVKFSIEYKETAKSNWYVIQAIREEKALVDFKVKIKDEEYQAAFDKALDYLKWYWVRL